MIIPETYFSVSEQSELFLISCACGSAFGGIYDLFRAIRIILPHNTLLVAIEDITFMLIYSVFIICFVSVMARGEFRFFYILGNCIGFAFYYFTIGSVVIKIIRYFSDIIKNIFSVVFYPIKAVYVFLCKKVNVKFVGFYKNIVKKVKIHKST